jgi:hypothetical protein
MDEPKLMSEQSDVKARRPSPDSEILAISTILASLEALEPEAVERVLSYIFQRLSVRKFSEGSPLPRRPVEPASMTPTSSFGLLPTTRRDIRSFAEEKKPDTATEKAALIAFFLSELATIEERRDSIGQDEITRYFKQAGFPLPASPPMTLVHAKNAGFFEVVSAGQYRLNPVGYNLVAHRLPRASGITVQQPSRSAPKKRTKPAVKKTASSKRAK